MATKKSKQKKEIIRFDAQADTGLTSEQVKTRIKDGLTNEVKSRVSKSYRSIFAKNIFTFFNLIWFIIATILFYLNAYGDMFFLCIVIPNTLIGIIQEIKAKRTVDKLSIVNTTLSIAIRNCAIVEIPSNEFVLDEIIEMHAGNQISADSILLTGNVEVNESLLTGESVSVKKLPGDNLYAGSYILSGICRARVDKIGKDTFVQQLTSKAKKLKGNTSELLRSLQKLINTIGLLMIPLTLLIFFKNRNLSSDIETAILKTSGAVIGMIPSGMFLLTTVALAVGVVNLAKKRTLVQDLYCIEMLARSTVLCLDKTGTITDGTMQVKQSIPLTKNFDDVSSIISSMMFALKDSNQTATALAKKFGNAEIYQSKAKINFSSARKFSAVELKNKGTFAVGAAEYVLKNIPQELQKQINEYSSIGLRVLIIASSKKSIDGETLPQDMKAQFLLLLQDHIRDDAKETIQWFKDNDVKIRIISGDNALTVSEIARRVGVDNADNYISLENLSDEEVFKAATEYTVFGRVSPDQKSIIVKALKASGEVVSMTGDGVNDILSLKEADCSVAMASGSEATRNIANLVLLDSNFSAMPKVVEEGRRVINNIQKTSSLFLMKTFFVIILVLLLVIIPLTEYPYPFTPKQMMVLEIFVIGMPSFFLALQPNKNLIKGNFLPTVIKKALPSALVMVLNVLIIYLFTEFFHKAFGLELPKDDASEYLYTQIVTLCIISTTFIGYLTLALKCMPFNKYRTLLFTVMLLAGCGILWFMPSFFDLSPVGLPIIAAVLVLLALDIPLFFLLKFIIKQTGEKLKSKNKTVLNS